MQKKYETCPVWWQWLIWPTDFGNSNLSGNMIAMFGGYDTHETTVSSKSMCCDGIWASKQTNQQKKNDKTKFFVKDILTERNPLSHTHHWSKKEEEEKCHLQIDFDTLTVTISHAKLKCHQRESNQKEIDR